MSMRDYGVDDYGIVLNGLCDREGKHPDFDEDWLEEMHEDEIIDAQTSFTGEAAPLSDQGHPDWSHEDYFNDETLYYLSLKKSPMLFKRAYKDMNELMDELVESYNAARKADDRLPELTREELRSMLRYISGSYNG